MARPRDRAGDESPYALMVRHLDALYRFDSRGRIVGINQWDGGTPPRFHLGRTGEGHVFRVRADVPEPVVAALAELCEAEPVVAPDETEPRLAARCFALLAAEAPVGRVRSGPAFRVPALARAPRGAIRIDGSNAGALRGGLDAWLPDVPHRQPFVAIVERGRAVAVCASVRITARAHEAGVETAPDARRRGHATSAVVAWAAAVRAADAIPLYSTSWDNAASRALARRLGLTLYGVDYHVT